MMLPTRTRLGNPVSFIALVLILALAPAAEAAKSKPKYGKNAVPLAEDSAYFRGATKTDFWKLIPYYVPQHNDKACGVASSIMVLNALFAADRNTADGKNVDVEEIQKLAPAYKKHTGTKGKGFTVDELGDTLTKLLETAEGGPYTVTVERFDGKDKKAEMKRLEKLLAANEKNPRDFILANFLQSVLTGDPEGSVGHIAPIGAFDARKKRVLILDPDRKYYQPYWVPYEKLFDGINTTDSSTSKSRGLVVVSH
ncbi:MAG: hypothetical protein JST04_04545 [Bdellovibrionales bacterium]|nr:hypothetical protein [Bdellovibrionales bacterium]